MIINSLDYD